MNWSRIFLIIQSLLLATLCGMAASSDIKTGKVPNKLLRLALEIISACILIYSVASGIWPWNENSQGLRFVLNILIGCAVSIGLYMADIWAPGDAKLFIVIVLLYPPLLQTAHVNAVFPSLQIVIWMFSIGYLYLLFENIIKRKAFKKNDYVEKQKFSKAVVLSIGLNIVTAYCFSLFVNILASSYMPAFYEANRALYILGVICSSILLSKLTWWGKVIVAITAAAGSAVLMLPYYQAISFSVQSIVPFAVAMLVGILTRLAQKNNYQEISPDDLHAGMILSMFTVCRFLNSKIPGLPSGTTETRRSRLNMQEAEAVRQWTAKKKEPIVVVRTLPFAPFIAAGTILELILGWFLLYR